MVILLAFPQITTSFLCWLVAKRKGKSKRVATNRQFRREMMEMKDDDDEIMKMMMLIGRRSLVCA